MVTAPASSAENGDPGPPPGPPPPLNSSLPPPATDALPGGVVPSALRMPFVQPPFRRACTRRWLNEVDPTVYRGEWTEEEKSRLRHLVETLRTSDKVETASSWSIIAELLAAVRSPRMNRTAAWLKCPLRAQSSGGAFARSISPCGHTRRSRGARPRLLRATPRMHTLGLRGEPSPRACRRV